MITAWAVTTGEAGMRTQARGLARAVAEEVVEQTAPAGLIEQMFWRGPDDRFAPPWPDILITCGRRSALFSIRLRKLSGAKMLAVHIQDPRAKPNEFDLIVAMEHDRIAAGGNVIKVPTALHDVTPERLRTAADGWARRMTARGRPLAAVMVGGSTARQAFTAQHGARLLVGLKRLRTAGISLAITPSRRTPAPVREQLRTAFAGDPHVYQWDMTGENPYLGLLGLADRLVVTSDSVSMISEALATGHPVEVFDFGTEHYGRFLDRVVSRGWARRFEGDPNPPLLHEPINATDAAAAAVRELLQIRTGVVG